MSETTAKGNSLLRGERLQIMLERSELQAVEDFRFGNRLPSRAAAVRELLRRGLAAEGFVIPESDGSSRSFGVLEENDRHHHGVDHADGQDHGPDEHVRRRNEANDNQGG